MTFACAIFIRMPFAEGDGYGGLDTLLRSDFYSHAPREM